MNKIMNTLDLTRELKSKYPDLIDTSHELPAPYIGTGKIKAVILGADPTHIVNDKPRKISKVFDLDDEKSPYWRGIKKNLDEIRGLSVENIHVENLCRNYFTCETSKNKDWIEIARKYWAPFLRDELDNMYSKDVPVLITTQFILFAILNQGQRKMNAETIYKSLKVFAPSENLLNRGVFAFYRHWKYSLKGYGDYAGFLSAHAEKVS
jgi:hypothetical protein